MNILSFVGKIEYLQLVNDHTGKFAQVVFIEKNDETVNYIPCIIPNLVLEDYEDHLNIGTILEVIAHVDSKTVIKDDELTIIPKFIVDKISYFELNEDIVDTDVKKIAENFFNNKQVDDVPF